MSQGSVATAGIVALLVGALGSPATAWGQVSPDRSRAPWEMMHDWGWGAMFLMPLFMLAWLAVFVAVIVLLVRWLGAGNSSGRASPRTARDVLDERYARGEINREEYVQRKNDIAGK